ncbi:hypothetical protein MUP79_02190 [Candidatus Bathyarchaeota archaeon]|nr:hypothetical protein [Candidatus Bathyarchaeota archaeon]
MSEENRKKRVVNMNYPPDDMPLEEQERFWGTVTKEDIERVEKARKTRSNARPSPV